MRPSRRKRDALAASRVLGLELRRALLLFAIVLGLAAIVSTLARPADKEDSPAPVEQQAEPARGGSSREAATITFPVAGERVTRRLTAGRAASVIVETDSPGLVEIAGLGLTQAAAPVTPARFEVLTDRPGRYPVRLTPSGTDEARTLGMLAVTER